MKNISEKNKTYTFKGFGGIDTVKCQTDPNFSSDIVNLRIRADGSLQKREGYRRVCTFENGVRTVWSGMLYGTYRLLVLSADKIYSVDISDGTYVQIASIDTSTGEADFFFYRGKLYLIDGQSLYGIGENGIFEPFGYVPLIGKDWSDFVSGEPYEPRNLLNNKGRISYIISDNPATILRLVDGVSSIDAVYQNGMLVSPDRYSLNTIAPILNFGGFEPRDRIEVYFTYGSAHEGRAELLNNTRAFVFGGINTSRPFLYGGNDSSVMYSCSYVREDILTEIRKVYADTDALYFPVGHQFCVGDGRFSINSVSRHYDRMLIFTSGGTWMADSSACGIEEFPVMNINSSVGVNSRHGACLLENFPYTASNNGIYRWTAETDEQNDCNAYRISSPVDTLMCRDFLADACLFADKKRRELLISSPMHSDRTLVYSVPQGIWTTLSGIDAEYFFDLDGSVAFLRNGGIFVLDETEYTDDGQEISSCLESGEVHFGTGNAKHLIGFELTHKDGDILCSLFADGKALPSAECVFYSESTHKKSRRRASSGRFSHAKLKLCTHGNTRHKIYTLGVSVRTKI